MSGARIEIRGERGLFADVRVSMALGDRIVVGRSRFSDLSAATTPAARVVGRARLEASEAFRKLSRRHFELAFESADSVVVRDLSTNGVLLNGTRVRSFARVDPADLFSAPAILRFGAGEELLLRALGRPDA